MDSCTAIRVKLTGSRAICRGAFCPWSARTSRCLTDTPHPIPSFGNWKKVRTKIARGARRMRSRSALSGEGTGFVNGTNIAAAAKRNEVAPSRTSGKPPLIIARLYVGLLRRISHKSRLQAARRQRMAGANAMTQNSLHAERILGDMAEHDLEKTAVYGRAAVKRRLPSRTPPLGWCTVVRQNLTRSGL